MTVQWLAEALLNLADILDAVAEESLQGAARLSAKIQSITVRLETHPKLYKAGRVRGTRECVISDNYLLVYRLGGDDVRAWRHVVSLQRRDRWDVWESAVALIAFFESRVGGVPGQVRAQARRSEHLTRVG